MESTESRLGELDKFASKSDHGVPFGYFLGRDVVEVVVGVVDDSDPEDLAWWLAFGDVHELFGGTKK